MWSFLPSGPIPSKAPLPDTDVHYGCIWCAGLLLFLWVYKSFAGYPLFLGVFVVCARHFYQGQALGRCADKVLLFVFFVPGLTYHRCMTVDISLRRHAFSEADADPRHLWWRGLSRLLSSLDALSDGRILYTLLTTLASVGLMGATTQASLLRRDWYWAVGQGAVALFCAFYGAQAAGLQSMDRARGFQARSSGLALRDALRVGHRFLLAMLAGLFALALPLVLLLGLFWLCGLPRVGPLLYGFVAPLTVMVLAAVFALGGAVLLPLVGPAVWTGARSQQVLMQLLQTARQHLLRASVFVLLLTALVALLGAVVSAVVFVGGRLMAELSIWLLAVDVQPGWLMLGLFGQGVSGAGLAQVPHSALPYILAAKVGGGLVFALAVTLPSLVYLRGVCEIYLLLNSTVDSAKI